MKILLTTLLAGISLTAGQLTMAIPQQSTSGGDVVQQANASAAEIADAQSFLAEIDQTTQQAREGLYGSISAPDYKRMLDARDTIHRLLDGQQSALDLKPEQRVELFNAQETFAAVIRNDDLDRKVCKREKVAGSRMGKYECLTVREREERTRRARESTERQQRVICTKGNVGC
ncbi:MAG: hypothetical protein KDI51_06525 [Xanthomonadales bacterium]|nr:hypothetical protein [Xanthomonadales bacterium]